jgi:hypothetical protein
MVSARASSRARICLAIFKAFAGALESFSIFVALGIADDLTFERFDGVLEAFDKLGYDADCGRLILDLDGTSPLIRYSPKTGRTRDRYAVCEIRLYRRQDIPPGHMQIGHYQWDQAEADRGAVRLA